jgi:hypothetical protein
MASISGGTASLYGDFRIMSAYILLMPRSALLWNARRDWSASANDSNGCCWPQQTGRIWVPADSVSPIAAAQRNISFGS